MGAIYPGLAADPGAVLQLLSAAEENTSGA